MIRNGDPCPSCGQPVEVERIEVTTWADGPNNPQYIDGRACCPSGCERPWESEAERINRREPMISREAWDAAVTEPPPVPDFSADRMARAIDEAIRHNASILERHRTEEDPFYWGDAMQWTGDRQ